MRVEEIKKEIDHLDVSEKLTLIEAVWDEIAQSNQELPLPEWQKKELSERLFLYKDASIKTKDGTKVHEHLRNKYK